MSSLRELRKKFRRAAWREANYTPSVAQRVFHDCRKRLRLIAGGVRAGKSFSTARELDDYAMIRDGLGWVVGPDYEQCRPEFQYLLENYQRLGLVKHGSVSFPSRGPARFQLITGFQWQTKSSGDPISLASYAPDVLAMVEAAQQPYEAYLKVLERSTEKRADVILSGTFESSFGWYADQWDRWQAENPEDGMSFSVPTWSNEAVFPGGRNDKAILEAEASMAPELFMERYGGIPCKPSGLVFPEFDRKLHLRDVGDLFDPDLPVELWIDPATHTYAVLFVQMHGDAVHVLDEVYAHGVIGQEVIPQVVESRYWPLVSEAIIDIAGSYRQGANLTQIEVWANTLRELKTHQIHFGYRKISEFDWRNAIKLRLAPPGKEPLLYFASHLDDRLSADGLAYGVLGELKSYRWPKRGEAVSLPGRPLKRNEDALSALGYGLVIRYGAVVSRGPRAATRRRAYWS